MEILGYLCSLLIGISLGTLGSGGSILTVPIMVYLLSIDPVDATGYSLFVVGITSAVGFLNLSRKDTVDFKKALIFAIPSLVFVYLTRIYLVHTIPNQIPFSDALVISKDRLFMILFAILMLIVAGKIIFSKSDKESREESEYQQNYFILILAAIGSGILTGFLGVGGGFIIIPALLFFGNVLPKLCVGTSLLIIAGNSFIGFTTELIQRKGEIDYGFLTLFSVISIVGVFIGTHILSSISSKQTKNAFGYMVLVVGMYIIVRELFLRH